MTRPLVDPEVGTEAHAAWRLLMAVLDSDADRVSAILGGTEDPHRLAFDLATLAAGLWEAPCEHCDHPDAHAEAAR